MSEGALTPVSVAQRLAVRPKTIRGWLKQGKLKGVKVGRLWRIQEKDLHTFLSEEQEEVDEETRVWIEAEMSDSSASYDWGDAGIPEGKPVRYVSGVGLVIE